MNPAAPPHPRIFLAVALLCAFAAIAVLAQEPRNNPPTLTRNPAAALATPTPAPQGGPANVHFTGATKFTEAQLRSAIADQITEMNTQGVGPATADDAAFFLSIFYRKHGYASVSVDWKILGPHSVGLAITEGPLTTLGNIEFRGVSKLPVKTLHDYITSTTRERFPNPKAALPFVQADVDTGVERIRGLYASEGFLDAVVDPAKVTFSPDKSTAAVLVTVHEGTQYFFGKITFAGDLVFYPNTELLNQLKPFTSKPYTPEQTVNMQRAIVYYYKTHGYYDPKVDVASDPKTAVDGRVPITFTIESGAVYRFDGVSQDGLERLNPKFLPDRFASLHGKFYNPELLDEKFKEMMKTGLFRQLRIEPRPLPDDTIELHLHVEEEKARELGFSAGYGTFEGPIIGLVAGDRDLFGTGRPLTAKVELSANFLRGEILYQDPWWLNSDYKLDLRLYGQSELWYRYSVLETGFRPQISRQLTKQLTAAVFLQAKEVKTTDQGIDPSRIGPDSYFVNSAGASITFDTRAPDKLSPRQGVIGDAVADVASSELGSSVEFARVTARLSYYIPVTSKTLLALGARGGWMRSLMGNPNDIPIDERFFNGGSRSVRSFPERRLGPEDWHGYPIGGDTFTTFNAEYQFPLYGEVIGALFADAGSVGETPHNIGVMRYGVGPGLRYASPVGPLRLDVGFNPDRHTGERHMMIQISFGMAF
ncbi:MAG TPA: BamA/TamA family outer membrane protein [Chthoniobacteraceae bacterium]|jgi:outer membrane protein assembly complex protein YaeT|nr:BamA/TamA family outer membrane protein [Chthoniobacteraceae bacterium]